MPKRPPVAPDDGPDREAADPDIIACGAVVLRRGKVLLVHRPKYDDWAFPKGKQERGEQIAATAVREVVEETGVEIRLGRPLPATAYLQGSQVKLVHSWRGHVIGDPDVSLYKKNREIDKVRWVSAEKAVQRLTYPRDRELLQATLDGPGPTRTLVVVRHAKARSRKRWHDDDRLRPLLKAGEKQAVRLNPVLHAYGVTQLVSSTSERCVQTLTPYAEEQVLDLGLTSALSEEDHTAAGVARVVGELLASKTPTALCTHRPVLPKVFRALGLEPQPLDPGDALVVHHRKGEVLAVEHHHFRAG